MKIFQFCQSRYLARTTQKRLRVQTGINPQALLTSPV